MSESVQFWLDNKMSAGIKVAEVGSQQLVIYRDKYYVIENGAARMKGSKPLYFSKSSMPLMWKKALRGDTPPMMPDAPTGDDTMPKMSTTKKARHKPEPKQFVDEESTMEKPEMQPSAPPTTAKEIRKKAEKASAHHLSKAPVNKPVAQSSVTASCPYCNQKQELPLDKGRNGRPFFVSCTRCKADFAVRYVPVTMYQAQVAGFR